MHLHWISLVTLVWSLHLAAAGVLHASNTPGNVVNCTSRSAAIHNLTVYGTEILYTVPTPTVQVDNGTDTTTSFEFQLYNSILGVDAQCSTHVNQTVPGDEGGAAAAAALWHTCFVESRDTRITAAFRFDLERHTLMINETWVCDGAEEEGGGTFQAWATNSIAILCQETVNIDLGQHYCASMPDVPLPVNVTRIG